MTDPIIHRAITEIAQIRRAIEWAEGREATSSHSKITLDANLILQTSAFILATLILFIELISRQGITTALQSPMMNFYLMQTGLFQVAGMLFFMILATYFVIWRAAHHSQENVHSYIAKNFNYLKNLSIASDLFLKFCFFALVSLAGRPFWIPPLLFLFTGDFLIQGKLFTLPVKWSLATGLFCFSAAMAQFYFNSFLLICPLVTFLLILSASLFQLIHQKQSQKAEV